MNYELIHILSKITNEEHLILKEQKLNKTIYTNRKGFTIDRERMLERGKLIALRPHTRFIKFPSHCHNYIEIMYVCRGSITHIINGRHTVVLRQGELLFLNCHSFHEIEKAGQNDIAINFIVLPQFFDTAYEMLGGNNILSQFIADNLQSSGDTLGYLHFKVSDVLPVQNLVENLVCNIINRMPNRKNINQVTMGLLFLQLLNQTERIDLPVSPDYDNRIIIAVLREVEENYQSASLTGIAGELNQSVYSLSKLIKQTTGRTFKQILQEKRFSKALQLLLSTKLSVSDIAAYVGYENTSYFHRRFLEIYNMSPAKYRALHSGK